MEKPHLRVPFVVRLERKIERIPFSGCWIYLGRVNRKGYGMMDGDDGTPRSTHRHLYEKSHGITLTSKQRVCHRCDVPACCNPDHLFVGTDLENHIDALSKGRKVEKLTPQIVAEVRLAYANRTRRKWGMEAFAKKYGISTTSLRAAIYGDKWANRVSPAASQYPARFP